MPNDPRVRPMTPQSAIIVASPVSRKLPLQKTRRVDYPFLSLDRCSDESYMKALSQYLNDLSNSEAGERLEQCCAASRWVEGMLACRPFASDQALHAAAQAIWEEMEPEDILEAFSAHPMIGDVASLQKKYAHTGSIAASEQSGVQSASHETILQLAAGNQLYRDKFGYIFIICATNKSAGEMLDALELRLDNDPAIEMKLAAAEQFKITSIRLQKLVGC